MSQKSSVPQAISFVSQVLKRDTCRKCGTMVSTKIFFSYAVSSLQHLLSSPECC